MNASMFLLTGAALGLSILAVSSHPSAPVFCPPDEMSSSSASREYTDIRIPDEVLKTVTLDTSKLALAPRSTAYNLRLDRVTRNLVLSGGVELASTPLSTSSSPEIKTSTFVPPSPLPAEFAERRISLSVKESPLEEVLQSIGGAANLSPAIAWPVLENVGVTRDTPITLTLKEAPLDQVIAAVSAALTEASSTPFAARSDGTILEFAPVAYFDQRETTLVSYDLSNVNSVEAESLSQLIYTFVEPDGWRENGGTTAWLRFAGPKMFVQAPKRYHAHIQWFLSELQAD